VISYCAVVDPSATVPETCDVWHHAYVREDAVLGEGVVLGHGAHVGPGVSIGNCTHVGNMAQLHDPAEVGSYVFIGPQAFLSNDPTPMVGKQWTARGVTIGDHAVIGAGAMILGGVTIGEGAVLGMGCMVIRDVEPGKIVVGNPARVIRDRDKHMVGTAFEHWAPLGEEDGCPWCAQFNERAGGP